MRVLSRERVRLLRLDLTGVRELEVVVVVEEEVLELSLTSLAFTIPSTKLVVTGP